MLANAISCPNSFTYMEASGFLEGEALHPESCEGTKLASKIWLHQYSILIININNTNNNVIILISYTTRTAFTICVILSIRWLFSSFIFRMASWIPSVLTPTWKKNIISWEIPMFTIWNLKFLELKSSIYICLYIYIYIYFFKSFRPQERQHKLQPGRFVLWPKRPLVELLQLRWRRRRLRQHPSSKGLWGKTPNPLNHSLYLVWNDPDCALTVDIIMESSAVAEAQSTIFGAEDLHSNIAGDGTKSTKGNRDFLHIFFQRHVFC